MGEHMPLRGSDSYWHFEFFVEFLNQWRIHMRGIIFYELVGTFFTPRRLANKIDQQR